MEEGQLERFTSSAKKEFGPRVADYKGKVTRVLPGMQSAFVDIGLDGDAFLYSADVFENLEGYDHGSRQSCHSDHGHGARPPRPSKAERRDRTSPRRIAWRAHESAPP